MTKKYDVAIVGATGAVGETLVSILDQRNFPNKQSLSFSFKNVLLERR